MSSLGVARPNRPAAARLAAMSRAALDRPLHHDAELLVAEPSDAAVVLGAMQRVSELGGACGPAEPLLRRASGGAEVRVGPGTLWIQLALSRPDALVDCKPDRLMNRYVRPLLQALTRVGALARYFDRDWISVAKRPVGMIAFAHDAGTGRALVEAVIAVGAPFAARARPSYLGKLPATLAEIGATVDVGRVAAAVVDAYAASYGRSIVAIEDPAQGAIEAPDARLDPPWAATHDEAIGVVAAGRDRDGLLRIGGELMASRDAVARLEERLAVIEPAEIGRALDESLHAPAVALFGVRSLGSLRNVIASAW